MKYVALLCLITLSLPTSGFVHAQEASFFNPDYLLSDTDMLDVQSMSATDIQRFLHRGALHAYSTTDIDGSKKTAAQIIWNAAQTFSLSPRFLLALLQREQSLIEDPTPSQDQLDWAMGYGVCDDCKKSDPRLQKFKGFAQQIFYASERIRESYLADLERRGYTETGLGPGIVVSIDNTRVVPANFATASLYTYTPHVHGNKNFVAIWTRWFETLHPSGTLLQDKASGGIWLIQNGVRRPITSRAAFFSRFNTASVVPASVSTIEQYALGAPISFPNYSLLRSPGGTVYLIVDDTRRGFTSTESFRSLGFHPDEVVDVSWDDLNVYTEAAPITIKSVYPQGALLQDQTTGGVFYVENGMKHPLLSRQILSNRFSDMTILPVSPSRLEEYELGEAIGFRDGTLIGTASAPDIFVIADGKRHAIVDEVTFFTFGWNWNQVVWTDERSLLLHELGDPLSTQLDDEVSLAQF